MGAVIAGSSADAERPGETRGATAVLMAVMHAPATRAVVTKRTLMDMRPVRRLSRRRDGQRRASIAW